MNPENIINDQNDFSEISLKELLLKVRGWWRFLLSKWLIILFCGIVGGLLGFGYASLKKTIYTATTTFVLEDGGSGGNGIGNLGGLASMVGIDVGGNSGGIFQGDNILELYKSRTMIEKTLLTTIEFESKSQLLIDRYLDFNGFREKWSEVPELKNIQFIKKDNEGIKHTRLKDSIIGLIVNDINKNYLSVVKPDRKLSLIKVEVKSKDEYFAKAFDDQIVKNVNDFYIQTKTKKSLENISILQGKADSVRAGMSGAIYKAAEVADATPNLNPTRQTQRIAPIQRSQFLAEANKAVLTELVKNLEMSKMSLLKEAPLIQIVDQPVFPLKQETTSRIGYFLVFFMCFSIVSIFILCFRRFFINAINR
ncbi:MAG: lipopolysaccharide biosynthesis protein [Candidatus Pedobacter colombiensis]|uniref:Lipopolysaccharide biosynthesis protein n=1 Tax=Candidatus Pedobacter colombiensis TaxID=3121371 RepID=A0AAJ6B792_9SPHI|nr:lipopolysaccharide biosynthesis protein [Pedobacter sp.]WEK19654.1 MAG: lipopolysaccharide biosynthesis protein [Pedobacter sp.]